MFKKHFGQLHEKIYFYSYLVALISLFLPWLRGFIVYIPGIILPFGSAFIVLLSVSAGLFYNAKRKKKVPAVSTIIMGILCIATTIGHIIAYELLIDLGMGLFGYSIGIYLAILGSIGILISGLLAFTYKKNNS